MALIPSKCTCAIFKGVLNDAIILAKAYQADDTFLMGTSYMLEQHFPCWSGDYTRPTGEVKQSADHLFKLPF